MDHTNTLTNTPMKAIPVVEISPNVHSDQCNNLPAERTQDIQVMINESDEVLDELQTLAYVAQKCEFNNSSELKSELGAGLVEEPTQSQQNRLFLLEQYKGEVLSEKARSAVACLMSYGCTIQIFPYAWDSVKFRLTKNSRIENWWFNFHSFCMFLSYSFVTFRCVSTVKEQMPARVRMMNIVWVVAYGLTSFSTIQFYRRREEIMLFANALFESLQESRRTGVFNSFQHKEMKRSTAKLKSKSNWSSRIVLISSFMLYTSGPAHAMVLWYGPCTPTYISSVIHNCTTYMDMPLSILEATPYVLWEYYIIGFVLAVWSFNWTLIFLGWIWIKDNLKKIRSNIEHVSLDYAEEKFRYCQVFAALMNDAFALYLRAFPLVLFIIAGMMLFGTIRYTYLLFHLYMVFPSCGLRCLFEAVTALGAAGMMNYESIQYLNYMKKRIDSVQDETERKHKSAFHKSCRAVLCTAGSMYTFENSIVLVSLYHCTQLTFNMLVTYD